MNNSVVLFFFFKRKPHYEKQRPVIKALSKCHVTHSKGTTQFFLTLDSEVPAIVRPYRLPSVSVLSVCLYLSVSPFEIGFLCYVSLTGLELST